MLIAAEIFGGAASTVVGGLLSTYFLSRLFNGQNGLKDAWTKKHVKIEGNTVTIRRNISKKKKKELSHFLFMNGYCLGSTLSLSAVGLFGFFHGLYNLYKITIKKKTNQTKFNFS